jgi:hypothetical protein
MNEGQVFCALIFLVVECNKNVKKVVLDCGQYSLCPTAADERVWLIV